MRFVLRISCVTGWFGCPAVGVMKRHLSQLSSQGIIRGVGRFTACKRNQSGAVLRDLCPGLAVKPESSRREPDITMHVVDGLSVLEAVGGERLQKSESNESEPTMLLYNNYTGTLRQPCSSPPQHIIQALPHRRSHTLNILGPSLLLATFTTLSSFS